MLSKINSSDWLENIQRIHSPNFENRPTTEISLIIIHNISLAPFCYGGTAINDLFTNQIQPEQDPFFQVIKDFRVSSHLLINREGLTTQFVPFSKMAYHAGISEFQGKEACNHFSIGIEMEGCDFEPFTEKQYRELINILNVLIKHYPITAITGHQHVAPQRKTDPGHFFEWQKLKEANLPVKF